MMMMMHDDDGGGDYDDDDDDEMVKVERVMMVMMKLKMVGGEGDFDDDYDVLLRTLQTQKHFSSGCVPNKTPRKSLNFLSHDICLALQHN